MKKIALISLLLVFISSCSTMTNSVSETKKVNNEVVTQQAQPEVENTNTETNTESVELTPDEEKVIDDLLNF